LNVQFDGTLSPGASSYEWTFGDGNVSNIASPNHLYGATGTYTVTLKVTNICSGTNTIQTTITVCELPQAIWTFQIVSSSGNGMVVQFNGTSSIGANSFLWEFGDGNTNNTSPTPVHTYAVPGLFYVVKLTVTNTCGDKDIRQISLGTVGLEDLESLGVKVYPNPVDDYLILSVPDIIEVQQIRLTDMSGKWIEVPLQSLGNEIQLTTSHLPAGMYMLSLSTDQGSSNWHILIQH
jgi:hypothetical protein